MGKKNLGTATAVTSMQEANSVIIEVGGSIRRIALENFREAINKGNQEFLLSSAWGIPLKQNQSSPDWGIVGNKELFYSYAYGSKAGRYLVTSDGKAAKLSVYDSNVYADGTPLEESMGNVMAVFPDLYYRTQVDPVTHITTLWMSPLPISDLCIKHPVIGAYKGSMSGEKLVSRSGVTPASNKTINEFWSAAQKNSTNWGITSYEHRIFIQMLALSFCGASGSANLKSRLNGLAGLNGTMGANARSITTGATRHLGDGFLNINFNWQNDEGEAVVNACRISICGIEDPIGWMSEFAQGIYCGSSNNPGQNGSEVFIYKGNRIPTSAELTSTPSGEYEEITRLTDTILGQFIKQQVLEYHFFAMPSVVGEDAGSNSYWCDQYYTRPTGQVVLFGGNAGHNYGAGFAFMDMGNGFNYKSQNVSARLAYYGDLEIVDGKDIARN